MIIEFKQIGIIHTPFKELTGMPIQPSGASGIKAEIELYPEYADGSKGLDGFSHIILIYHFHKSEGYSLLAKPFLFDELLGVFATRAPKRPNQIGLSIVELKEINNNILKSGNIDVIDGTPLLDIKPYVPKFDSVENVKIGWLTEKADGVFNFKSDERFSI